MLRLCRPTFFALMMILAAGSTSTPAAIASGRRRCLRSSMCQKARASYPRPAGAVRRTFHNASTPRRKRSLNHKARAGRHRRGRGRTRRHPPVGAGRPSGPITKRPSQADDRGIADRGADAGQSAHPGKSGHPCVPVTPPTTTATGTNFLFFSPTTVWNQPLSDNAPLDPNSAAITGRRRRSSRRSSPTEPHSSQYSTPIYTMRRSNRQRR